jgi:4-hydroxythreonine-4-phosphate dehydrogenase
MNVRIGISLGDITGVGPEITLKALARLRDEQLRASFTVLGDRGVLQRVAKQLRLPLNLDPDLCVVSPCAEPLPLDLSPGAAPAAQAAVDWVREGARRCLSGELDALVTAPVNKHAIVQAGIPFTGHTELLAQLADEPRTVMMLLGPDERNRWLRVALATVHLAIRDVPSQLSQEKVLLAIQRTTEACDALGLERARVGVCGLNPHAGEGGQFGDEEVRLIEPAIQEAQARGWDVRGPLSGDTVFYQALQGEYDAVVAMYHDQGLAPLKLAAFKTGVNWTLGLPFIRTSPDHGTAYNIAGQGVADPSSMIAAIRLARHLSVARRTPRS